MFLAFSVLSCLFNSYQLNLIHVNSTQAISCQIASFHVISARIISNQFKPIHSFFQRSFISYMHSLVRPLSIGPAFSPIATDYFYNFQPRTVGTRGNWNVLGNSPFNVENKRKHIQGSSHACGVPQVRDEFLEYFIPLMWCDLQKPFCKSQSKWRKCAFWGAKIILNDSNSLELFHMPRQQMLASQGLSNWIPNQQMLRNSLVLLAPGPYSIFWPMPTCSSLDLAAATWHWRGQPQRWMLWLGNVGDRKKGHHDVWVYKLNLLQHDVYSYMEMSKIPQIKPAWCSRHPAEEIDLDYHPTSPTQWI